MLNLLIYLLWGVVNVSYDYKVLLIHHIWINLANRGRQIVTQSSDADTVLL